MTAAVVGACFGVQKSQYIYQDIKLFRLDQSQFFVRNGKKYFLASYWFDKQGTSEGPQGFQTDSK